jgi:hypothetical protein
MPFNLRERSPGTATMVLLVMGKKHISNRLFISLIDVNIALGALDSDENSRIVGCDKTLVMTIYEYGLLLAACDRLPSSRAL